MADLSSKESVQEPEFRENEISLTVKKIILM